MVVDDLILEVSSLETTILTHAWWGIWRRNSAVAAVVGAGGQVPSMEPIAGLEPSILLRSAGTLFGSTQSPSFETKNKPTKNASHLGFSS